MAEHRHTQWLHSRALAEGRAAIVAKSELAAIAGAEAFAAGGNAFDAVAAALVASGVAQPYSTSLGGGGVAVAAGKAGHYGLDFRYTSPTSAPSPAAKSAKKGSLGYRTDSAGDLPTGFASIGVPGSVAGFERLVTLGCLTGSEIIKPAVDAARNGVPATYYDSVMDAYLLARSRSGDSVRQLLFDRERPHVPRLIEAGDLRVQEVLAQTLERIADDPGSFYRGEIADQVALELNEGGSAITSSDLAGFRPRSIGDAVEFPYGEWTLLGAPHPTPIVLMLKCAERLGLREARHGSARWLAIWLAAIDAARIFEETVLDDGWFADTASHPGHLESAIDSIVEMAERRLGGRSPTRPQPRPGPAPGSTVCVCAADASGNLVSVTDTILSYFGSMQVSSLGFVYNNGLSAFAPQGRANLQTEGTSPVSNMSPIIGVRAGVPTFAVSGSGGRAISSAVAQVVSNVVDFGLTIQQAIDAPRCDVRSGAVADLRLIDKQAEVESMLGTSVLFVEDDLTSGHFANVVGIERIDSQQFRCGVNSLHPAHGIAIA